MFNVDDTVMYGNAGVCKIIDIRSEDLSGEDVLYYILRPESDKKSIIYCPVNKQNNKIRKLLSSDEIYKLIDAMPEVETSWIENDQARKEHFNEIIIRGDHSELIKLIKTLYYNQQEKLKSGKKFHVTDERIMKRAESILYGEFAYVLNIEPNDVVSFISDKLGTPGVAEEH